MPTREEIAAHLDEVLSAYPNVPRPVAENLIGLESGWNQDARSPKGAMGLTQLMPDTAREMGVDPLDWKSNIAGGVGYLSKQINKFSSVPLGLAAYQSGPGRVERNLAQGGSGFANVSDGNMTPAQYTRRIMGDDSAPSPFARRLAKEAAPKLEGDWESRLGAPLPTNWEPAAEKEKPGLWGVTKNLLWGGYDATAQDFRETTRAVLGDDVIEGIDKLGEALGMPHVDAVAKMHQDALPPEWQDAASKEWVDETAGDAGGLTDYIGPAWSDWRSYFSNIVGSLPGNAALMIPAIRIGTVAGQWGTKKALASGLSEAAAKQAGDTAAARAAYISGALIEGADQGGQSARQVYDEIKGMDRKLLADSDAFKALIASGLTPDEAQEQLARDLRTQVYIPSAVATGIFSGLGDRALTNIIRGRIRGRWRAAGVEAGSEGAEELFQGYLSTIAENVTKQQADASIPTTAGALNQAVGGFVGGGAMGGALGAGLHRAPAQAEFVPPQAPGTQTPLAGEPLAPTSGAAPPETPTAPAVAQESPNAPEEPISAPVGAQPNGSESVGGAGESGGVGGGDTAVPAGTSPAETQAEVPAPPVAAEAPPAPGMLPGDIGRPKDGLPFEARKPADNRMVAQGLDATHEVAKIGDKAFVIRPRAQAQPAEDGAAALPPSTEPPVVIDLEASLRAERDALPKVRQKAFGKGTYDPETKALVSDDGTKALQWRPLDTKPEGVIQLERRETKQPVAETKAPAVETKAPQVETPAAKPEEPPQDFNSTQVALPGGIALDVKRAAKKIIAKADVHEKGLEDRPHVTVKYGLHENAPEAVRKLVESEPPIEGTIGKLEVFQPEGKDYDVLVARVDSPDLHRLNAKIAALPHTDTFPDYKPHVTLGYVKRGTGEKYAKAKNPLEGREFKISTLEFSNKGEGVTEIPLKGTKAVVPAPEKKKAKPKAAVSSKPEIKSLGNGTWQVVVGDKEIGRANLAEGQNYLTSIRIDPEWQRKGIGTRLHDAIEKEIGQPLRPSPTHQSEADKAFWAKRSPAKSVAVVADQGIINGRKLKRQFRRIGIDIKERSDVTGESGNGLQKTGVMPGTFRKGGRSLDHWGTTLFDEGWLAPESQSEAGNENVRPSMQDVREFMGKVFRGEAVFKLDDTQALSAHIEQQAERIDVELTPAELAELAETGLTQEEMVAVFDAAKFLSDAGMTAEQAEAILERAALQSDEASYEQAVRDAAAEAGRGDEDRPGGDQQAAAKQSAPVEPEAEADGVTPSGAPTNKSAYLDAAEYRKAQSDTYFGNGRSLNSRTTPQTAAIPPVGTWLLDPRDGNDGHDITELREVPTDSLAISEDTGPEKWADVERYAQWMQEGREPPPINAVQHVKGHLVVQDHRRLLAAKVLQRPTIKVWVDFTVNARRADYDGPTGLTYELAQQGATPDPIKPAPAAQTITASDAKAVERIRENLKPALELQGQTNAEVVAAEEKAKADAEAKAAADKAAADKEAADRELPGFNLSGSDRPADELAARGQGDLLSEPSADYAAAKAKAEAASSEFRTAQEQYRARKIGDDEFLAAKAKHDAASHEFDAAFAKEASPARAPPVAKQVEAIKPAPADPATEIETTGKGESIADFGEKIGGARKDTAKPLGSRGTIAREQDDRPAWARPYIAMEQTERSSSYSFPMRNAEPPKKTGKWELMRANRGTSGQVSRAVRQAFDTEADALAAIPLAEVARNHRTFSYTDKDGETKHGIFRTIGERKRALVKGGFATDEEAMKAMAADPVPIIEHKFQFPEKPWLDRIERVGEAKRKGDVTTAMFKDEFGFRAGEFGNWNMGSDGQAALNHAYDALHDLADTLGVPPKALSLNGELAVAFGARGTGGVGAASAHYEPDKVVINLTKIRGAGSLAHEWFHALDDYLTKSSDNAAGQRARTALKEGRPYATYGFPYNTDARPELIAAFKHLVDTMTAKKEGVAVDENVATRRLTSAQESLKYAMNGLRTDIAKATEYGAKKAAATPKQMKAWDELAARAMVGDNGADVHVPPPKGASRHSFGYGSSEVVRGLNAIYKEVRGRSFDRADPDSQGRRLFWHIKSVKDMQDRVAAAQSGTIEERRTGTEYLNEAKKIDGLRASDYWSTRHEMGARAFESYIFDKLVGEGKRSDYLAHGVENKYYALLDMKPYPEGDERKAIDAAFDDLFKVIQSKETDKGVALFSRAKEARQISGLPVEAVQKQVDDLGEHGHLWPETVTVQSVADLPFKAEPDARGASWLGKLYFVADNLRSAADVEFVAFHELFHSALSRDPALRSEFDRLLAGNQNLRKAAAAWRAANGRGGMSEFAYRMLSHEEALADLGRRGAKLTGVGRFLAAVQAWLRKVGLTRMADAMEGFTDAEALVYVGDVLHGTESESHENMRNAPAQSRTAPVWRSALAEAVAAKAPFSKAGEIDSGQLARWLEARTKDGTIKKDELEFSGLLDFLKLERRVTRDQVGAFLDENGVRLQEAQLTDDNDVTARAKELAEADGRRWDDLDPDDMALYEEDAQAEGIDSVANAAHAGVQDRTAAGAPKFAQWQLPGGSNYRELLLTLPSSTDADVDSVARRMFGVKYEVLSNGDRSKVQSELFNAQKADFKSSHFDQPNVLVHVRMNERTDADGKKVLFIEEIQSDWAQKGRKEGFADEYTGKPLVAKRGDGFWRIDTEDGRFITNVLDHDISDKSEGAAIAEAKRRLVEEKQKTSQNHAVPIAPFVGKTEAWVALALKRAIRYAADNGFDAVAWTNGDQQIDRYKDSLRQRVDRIVWHKSTRGAGITVTAMKDGKNVFEGDAALVTGNFITGPARTKSIEEVLGKGIAQQIREKPTGGKLEGDGLAIGGEGMRGFYDKIVPSVANDVLKKIGGGKVGEITLGRADPFGGGPGAAPLPRQPGFAITPAMRAAALDGLPMFSRRDDGGNIGPMPIKNVIGARFSEPVEFRITDGYSHEEVFRAATFEKFRAGLNDAFNRFAQHPTKKRSSYQLHILDPSGLYAGSKNRWVWVKHDQNFAYISPSAVFSGGAKNAWAGALQVAEKTLRLKLFLAHDIPEIVKGLPQENKKRPGIYIVKADDDSDRAPPSEGLGASNDPRFSRIPGLGPVTREGIQDQLAFLLNSSKTFNWWHKTVGTQFHKAEAVPAFKPVFRAAQAYINDTNQFSMDAAQRAPDLLPTLKNLSDVFRRGPSRTDFDAVAKATFDGTLIDNKVYSDDELAERGLTAKQVGMYHQTRAAIDRSLDDLAASIAAQRVRKTPGARQVIAQAKVDPDRAAQLYDDFLRPRYETEQAGYEAAAKKRAAELAAFDKATPPLLKAAKGPGGRLGVETARKEERADLEARHDAAVTSWEVSRDHAKQLLDDVRKTFKRAGELKQQGYAPLSRFGEFLVNVRDPETGESLFFGMYETQAEQRRMERRLKEQYPDAVVTTNVLSKEGYKLFGGISIDSLELFADAIGAEESEVFQQYLRLTINNRSALKRLIHRKGTPGFEQDVARVLATFVTSNARLASRNYHMGDMREAAEGIRRGDVKDEAVKLVDYVQNPQEEASGIRGLLFVNYLGGNIASALVNMTQPIVQTLPYLSQFLGPAGAVSALTSAGRQAASRTPVRDPALRAALAQADKVGITDPHEVHALYAESIQTLGTSLPVRKGLRAWGSLFALAEAFNRRITFIAAFQAATAPGGMAAINAAQAKQDKPGFASPFAFAENAVHETQGLYSKANKPNWARGPVGSTLFTFKQFSIAYVEFLKRLPRREQLLALAILVFAAGLQGIPFAEDLEDIIDTVGQGLGYNTNSKRWLHNLLPEFATQGVSGVTGFPVDLGRLGFGNMIPGTAVLKRSEVDKTRDVNEFFGPAGGFATGISRAFDAAVAGDAKGVASSMMPTAVQNALKAIDMMQTGHYRDFTGKNVVETTEGDAIAKAIGLQPQVVAVASRKAREIMQDIGLAKEVQSQIAGKMAEGRFERDPAKVEAARQTLRDWNEKNPSSIIRIDMAGVNKRVNAMRALREERIAKSAPKGMRPAVQEALR